MAGRPLQFRLQTLFVLTAQVAGGFASLRCIGETSGGTGSACFLLFSGASFGSAIGLLFGAGRLGAVVGAVLTIPFAFVAKALIDGINC